MKITNYLRDVRGEMKHVSWPTRRQTITFTILVIGISATVAAYLGILDFVFTRLLGFII